MIQKIKMATMITQEDKDRTTRGRVATPFNLQATPLRWQATPPNALERNRKVATPLNYGERWECHSAFWLPPAAAPTCVHRPL